MTTELLLAYVLGAMAASYLLLAWMYSTLPVHAVHVLRRLGWQRGKQSFWKEVPEWATLPQQMQEAMIRHDISPFLETLIGCRFCVSLHIAFWTSAGTYAVAACSGAWLPWAFIPAAVFSWPAIMLGVYKLAGE